jgi:hypothetical protein
MIDDIKEAVDSFKNQNGNALSDRDVAGINKIQFELDLLKTHEKRSKKKKVLRSSSED